MSATVLSFCPLMITISTHVQVGSGRFRFRNVATDTGEQDVSHIISIRMLHHIAGSCEVESTNMAFLASCLRSAVLTAAYWGVLIKIQAEVPG